MLAASVLVQAVTYLCRPVASYQVMAIGGGGLEIGMVTASFALVPLFVVAPMGRLADQGRVAAFLAGGPVLLAASALFLSRADTLPALLLGNAMQGVGHIATIVSLQSLIAMLSADVRHDRDFGLFTAAASLGQLIGPALGGAVLAQAGGAVSLGATQNAFGVAAGIAALGTLVGVVLARRTRSRMRGKAPAKRASGGLDVLRSRGLLAGILTSMAVLTAVDITTSYLPLLGEELGLSPAVVGGLLALRAGMSFISRLAIPMVMARVQRTAAIAGSSLLAAVCMTALTLTSNVVLLAAVIAVAGLLLGIGQPLSMTWVVHAVPESRRATALAHRLTGNRLGQALAPFAAGALTSSVGAAGPFWMTSGLLVASVALLFGGRGGRKA